MQTCKHELLDRTLIWNQRHLLHALQEFEQLYNSHVVSKKSACEQGVGLGAEAMHSGFGPRGGEFHRGQDIAAPIGTPIIAASSGTVLDSGPANGYGLWVKIEHAHSVNYQVRA